VTLYDPAEDLWQPTADELARIFHAGRIELLEDGDGEA